ncbi:MAG: hypothetical protein H6737_01745 [Alphaproteobacteria bacterium]|nr:hypothetical protein [Alphaproteobacteria bacterium]
MVITALIALVGCGGGAPPPSSTPEGKLCGRAYGSTIDSLDELYTKAGKDMPKTVPKEDYVKLCVEMGFTEAQLKCLDPKIESVDETCKKTLESVVDKKKKLAQSLLVKDAAPPAGEEKKEEGGE